MKVVSHEWGGVVATVYYMDRGDTIARHQHAVDHTTVVIVGSTMVEIFRNQPECFNMTDAEPPLILPANIDHEIRAMEPDTIVLNMIEVGPQSGRAADGGITLVD